MIRAVLARLYLSLAVILVAAGAFAQPQYEVVDLSELYGDRFTPEDINTSGVIGGHVRISSSQEQACVIENGQLQYLPKVDGHYWFLTDLADNGNAIGGGGNLRGYFYHDGKVVDIGVSGEHGENGFNPAIGLNDLGQVVGETGDHRPFFWQSGKLTFLDAPPFGGGAIDINDSSVIGGQIIAEDDEGLTLHAARWTSGKYQDLDPVWSERSEVRGINEAGNIAGLAYHMNGPLTAILWRGDKAIDLGDLGGGLSEAFALNDLDQVVGGAADERGVEVGFLWEKGTMYELKDLIPDGSGFVDLEIPFSINNEGQLLCSGFTGNDNHWLLLNPVPEPAGITILVIGICVTISRRKIRRE
jgi:probable HAF family extracellular repeat protein